eukprot:1182356-Prorocentrum_minimum.AAC.1
MEEYGTVGNLLGHHAGGGLEGLVRGVVRQHGGWRKRCWSCGGHAATLRGGLEGDVSGLDRWRQLVRASGEHVTAVQERQRQAMRRALAPVTASEHVLLLGM